MIVKENMCVCCDNCIHCGAREVENLACDKCKTYIDDDYFYTYQGGEYCRECMKEIFLKELFNKSELSDFISEQFDNVCEYFKVFELKQ